MSDYPESQDVANQALEIMMANPVLNALITGEPPKIREMPPGVVGTYDFKSEDIEIAPGQSLAETLKVLTHEYIHRNQHAEGSKFGRRGDKRTAPWLDMPADQRKQIRKDLEEANINYGIFEPSTYIAANMIREPQKAYDKRVLKFIEKHPELSSKYFKRGALPDRPVGKHFKGEQELGVFEKVLSKLFGVQFEVEDKLPPWIVDAINQMNEQAAQKE